MIQLAQDYCGLGNVVGDVVKKEIEMNWLKLEINKITNWGSLIEIHESCSKENYSDNDCKGCILHELEGEWEQEEVDRFFNKRLATKKETACFLIVHRKDKESIPTHGLDKIRRLFLSLEGK